MSIENTQDSKSPAIPPLPPATGSAALVGMLKDFRILKDHYDTCTGTDVFARRRELREGMKTVACKIAEEMLKQQNTPMRGG